MSDIALIDISLPDLTGLEILAIANSEGLPTRFVFFTACLGGSGPPVISAAAGAYAVSPKDVAIETLAESLRQVAEGLYLSSAPFSDQTVPCGARS